MSTQVCGPLLCNCIYFVVFTLSSSTTAYPPHRNQVDGWNLRAFTALGLNISGGSLVDRKHFMPTVGAHHRSGTHGRGGTDSFQHFIHSLCWALVHSENVVAIAKTNERIFFFIWFHLRVLYFYASLSFSHIWVRPAYCNAQPLFQTKTSLYLEHIISFRSYGSTNDHRIVKSEVQAWFLQ